MRIAGFGEIGPVFSLQSGYAVHARQDLNLTLFKMEFPGFFLRTAGPAGRGLQPDLRYVAIWLLYMI
jgi:hypothetical protein